MFWIHFLVIPFLVVFVAEIVPFLILTTASLWATTRISKSWEAQHRIQEQKYKRSDLALTFKASFANFTLNSLFYSLALGAWVRPHTKIYYDVNEYGGIWFLASIALLVIVHDAFFYWTHRTMHTHKRLIKNHRFHHRALNPFAIFSFNWTEGLADALWILPMCFLVPIHLYVLIGFYYISLFQNVHCHLSYEIWPSRWTRLPVIRWIYTPTTHAMHHRYGYCNFGFYFLFWDHVMGTLVLKPEDAHARHRQDMTKEIPS